MYVVFSASSPLLTGFVAFGENLVITAYMSKTGGDWWYGTVVSSGKAGFFPKTYVQMIETGESFHYQPFFFTD
jgi:Variant SH3 domain